MDELDHGLALSFSGAVRDAALSRLQTQVAQWKVALPPVEPLGVASSWLESGLSPLALVAVTT